MVTLPIPWWDGSSCGHSEEEEGGRGEGCGARIRQAVLHGVPRGAKVSTMPGRRLVERHGHLQAGHLPSRLNVWLEEVKKRTANCSNS